MELQLQSMTIHNFKGIHELSLKFAGKSAAISGKNGCGKSSIVDAFTWCMFGVNANGDSPGSDKFQEKPLDENGTIVHNLTTSVELDFTLDGKTFNVRREQSESWVKRRGSAEPTFQGNVSKFFINDVELKKNEFEQRIASIVSMDVFKQIGVLGYFNAMDWKKRRQYLMALAGDDVDKQLLELPEWKPIADEVNKRNIGVDDLKKVLTDQKKSLGKELNALPVRIDEVKKSLVAFKPYEAEDAEYIIADSEKDIAKVDKLIIETKAQGNNDAQITALRAELTSIRRRIQEEHEANRKKVERELEQATSNVKASESKRSTVGIEAEKVDILLSDAKKERDALRKEYMAVKAEKPDISDTCPTCGQPLPPDKVNEASELWEKSRKKRLFDIQTNGKKVAERIAELAQKLTVITEELERLNSDIDKATEIEEAAKEARNNYPSEPDFQSEQRIPEIEQQIADLEATQDTSGIELKVQQLIERKHALQVIVDNKKQILARRDLMSENENRLKEYESEMQSKGVALSECELLLDQLEDFTRARCSALEDRINGQFKSVRWKLFDVQINGSVVDCCTCMNECDGAFVPYASLNTASKIRSDIEISDILMNHYGLKIPILLDNGERITDIPKVDTQMIVLSVSRDDNLKIELIDFLK